MIIKFFRSTPNCSVYNLASPCWRLKKMRKISETKEKKIEEKSEEDKRNRREEKERNETKENERKTSN